MPPEKTASRTAVGGRFWGPFVTFHWATFQKPRDVCRDVCVLCFRDMFFLRFFFGLEQQLCCHKHVFFVLQVGDVSCFILFVQVWKDRSVDVSTFLMCVFVFPYFELEWLFLFQGMDDSRTWASSKVHSPPQKKHQLHAWCLTCILNQSSYICKERPFPEPYHEYSSVEPLQEVHSIGEVFSKSFLVIYGHRESTFLTKELLWWRQL